jgi:hypothetical protein
MSRLEASLWAIVQGAVMLLYLTIAFSVAGAFGYLLQVLGLI